MENSQPVQDTFGQDSVTEKHRIMDVDMQIAGLHLALNDALFKFSIRAKNYMDGGNYVNEMLKLSNDLWNHHLTYVTSIAEKMKQQLNTHETGQNA